MFMPSLEATRITIRLLGEYKDEEPVEDVLKLDYKFRPPEDILREHFAQRMYSEELQDAVAEFFFRVIKYWKYLNSVLKEILPSKSTWSVETPLYLAILYLLVIELNEVTKLDVEKLLIGLSETKAFSVLSSLKRSGTLSKLYESGCRIWDIDYVKSVLKNVIEKPLFQEVYETLANRKQKIKQSRMKMLTVPVGPRCLSYPKKIVRETLEPQSLSCPSSITRIPVMLRASKPPWTTYARPIQLERIEMARLRNREQAKRLYEEAQRKAFRVATLEKSEKFVELAEKIERERCGSPVKKLSSKKIKVKDVQQPKKTAAVILREGARLLKLEQEEIKRYEDLANGGFNSDALAEWEEEMREETYRKHLEDIEKKHLEGLLSYEEAVLAKQKCLRKKKESADEFRREKESWMEQLEQWRVEEQLRIQESVEKGKALERGAKEAVEQVREEKHKMALETMEESRALKERWLKEKEEDLQRKVQLIKEIKALQTLGEIKKKQTDLTETANLGLLYEMSLAELKERLFLLRIELQEELEKRRAEVRMKRECRKGIIDSYQELIESHQKIAEEQKKRSQSEDEQNERKKKREAAKCSSTLERLRQKLYEKRMARMNQEIFG